jgi:hypothetical protein
MPLSTELLIAEADRLVARTEREIERHRSAADGGAMAERAAAELKRLHLYRAILTSSNAAHALMPEYIVARGLFASEDPRAKV